MDNSLFGSEVAPHRFGTGAMLPSDGLSLCPMHELPARFARPFLGTRREAERAWRYLVDAPIGDTSSERQGAADPQPRDAAHQFDAAARGCAPSLAALIISGAGGARLRLMRTQRSPSFSRFAISYTLVPWPGTSTSSQNGGSFQKTTHCAAIPTIAALVICSERNVPARSTSRR